MSSPTKNPQKRPQRARTSPTSNHTSISPKRPQTRAKKAQQRNPFLPAVVEACLARIEHLSSEIGKEMVVVRNWEQEIKELREFLGLEEWE